MQKSHDFGFLTISSVSISELPTNKKRPSFTSVTSPTFHKVCVKTLGYENHPLVMSLRTLIPLPGY